MKLLSIERRFFLFQFFSYLSFGLCMTNLIPYMSELGLDITQRGFALSGCALINLLTQFLFGYLCDKYQNIKSIVILSTIMYTIGVVIFFGYPKLSIEVIIVCVSIFAGLLNTLCGLQDNWTLASGENMIQKLPLFKSGGSAGWMIGSFVSASLIAFLGYQSLSWLMLILFFLIFLIIYRIPNNQLNVAKTKINFQQLKQSLINSDYILLILSLFFMYSMVVANTTIVIDKMLALHASNLEISLKWAMGSLLEIPMYLMGYRLLKRQNAIQSLIFSALILIFQFILFYFAYTSLYIVFICILQIFTTPIILVSSKYIILTLVPKELQNSGQLIALSIYIGGSSFLIPLFNGLLIKQFSINNILLIYTIFGIISLTLLFSLKRKIDIR